MYRVCANTSILISQIIMLPHVLAPYMITYEAHVPVRALYALLA